MKPLRHPLKKVAYLGPNGTFSELAALLYFKNKAIEPCPHPTFLSVVQSLTQDSDVTAVIPIENSIGGYVTQVVNLIVQHPVRVVGELVLPIHQCLMSAEKSTALHTIFAHEQSLSQCAYWIQKHYPEAVLISTSSNAEAALKSKETPGSGALASKEAALQYDLKILAENIEDSEQNCTRFWIVESAKKSIEPTLNNAKIKTSMFVTFHDQSGALYQWLAPLSEEKINITQLVSCRVQSVATFLVTIEGVLSSDLEHKLRLNSKTLDILGSYPVDQSCPSFG